MKKTSQLVFDFIPDRELAYHEVSGRIQSVLYENPNTDWKVIEVSADSDGSSSKLAGFLPGIQAGDRIHARCTLTEHPRFGKHLQIDEFYRELPFQKTPQLVSLLDLVA